MLSTSSGPQALIERGDELRQVLHALDETLDFPAPDHDLIDLLDDGIAPVLGLLIPTHQRVVSLVVLLLVRRRPRKPDRSCFHKPVSVAVRGVWR